MQEAEANGWEQASSFVSTLAEWAADLFEDHKGRSPQRGCFRVDVSVSDKSGLGQGMGGFGAETVTDLHPLPGCSSTSIVARALARPW